MKNQPTKFGVAWYRAEQYPLLCALAVDSESMAPTYESWVANAKKTLEDLRQIGIWAYPVDLDVRALVLHCYSIL